jgi:trehalose-6-phosphatase
VDAAPDDAHGFDIWSPNEGEIQHDAASGFSDVVEATYRLRAEVGSIPGVVVEPKRASVAMHYQDQRDRRATTAGAVFAEPDRRKVMPGKMVYELQPKIDWGNADDLEIADRARRLRPLLPHRGGTAAVDSGPLTRAVRRPRGNRVRLRTRL